MTDQTKSVLAIVFGVLGLVIGIFATVVAVNARNAANSGEAVTQQVRTEFATAQAAQDAKEQAQVSKAERFVNSLSGKEKKVVREFQRIRRSVRQLKVSTAAGEADQADEFNRLNNRITKLQNQVGSLKKRVNQLQNELDAVVASG